MPNPDSLSLASKLERAVRWLLISNGAGTSADVYTTGYVGVRALPSRTIVVESIQPFRGNRREATLHLQIQHRFDASEQPGQNEDANRVQRDTMVAETDAVMTNQSDGASYELTANQITLFGRDLATPNGNLMIPAEIALDAKIVAANADMVNFRCDELELGTPYMERGHDAHATKGLVWMEILNFRIHASNSNGAIN